MSSLVSVGDAGARRLGLIVNPYAGIGGPLGLRGSDSLGTSGMEPSERVHGRTLRALRTIAAQAGALSGRLEVLAAPGAMGADAAREAGLRTSELTPPVRARRTTARDTHRCAAHARLAEVDLVLFAGGDGTCRDVTGALGLATPVLGVPAGVKMHSGVFAATPEQAGEAALDYLSSPGRRRLVRAEIADGDETQLPCGRIATKLFGEALVPGIPARVLGPKVASGRDDDGSLAGACACVAHALDADVLHLIGPGTTMARLLAGRGLAGSLLGVDAVRAGRLVGRDLDERALLELLRLHGQARLLLGVVGGQGMLLGRGNQQLSAGVVSQIDRASITVLAARDKLLALTPARLRIDTGDPRLDAELSGYIPVHVGPRERLIMEVGV
jgi:predicted polyphosphate/ATP-dependent NAD kinase